jgi:hemerythrin-like domain-containing protein
MNGDISSVLRELRRDHRNIAMLLDLIEREVELIAVGSPADFELLHDVMQYMVVYPDAVHHPREDRLYAELRARRPDLAVGFERISSDHLLISIRGRKLRDDFASVESGGMIARASLVAEALRYVNLLRSHMQWEEIDLFTRCHEMAAEGYRFHILNGLEDSHDPLFGRQAKARYHRLLERIRSTTGAHTEA